ncbi:hypothetical protein ABZ622_26255 [Streptomyces sp. NPDC007164]|uniref:hypothetical protein n=1 Tax=Streptomyces sp. NPDC007164 TaxID=3156918 RepID=UPI0033CDD2E8
MSDEDRNEGETLTVLGDSAYGTGDLREQLTAQGHALAVKPPCCARPYLPVAR